MVKETRRGRTTLGQRQELSEIGILVEDHLEEDTLGGYQEEIRQEEAHREETRREEDHPPEGTRTMMTAQETELIPGRSAATSIYSMETEQKLRNSKWSLAWHG